MDDPTREQSPIDSGTNPQLDPNADSYCGLPSATSLYGLPIIALDFETTGLSAEVGDAVCEVGLVAATGDRIEVVMSQLVNPARPLSEATRHITGIEDRDLVGAPSFSEVVPRMLELIGRAPLAIHNAPFDLQFLHNAVASAGLPQFDNFAIDTLLMARFLGRSREGNSLRKAAEHYGVAYGQAHRAAVDAVATALTYHRLVPYLEIRGIRTVGDLVLARMAGPAPVFLARPSSVLLDIVSRAQDSGAILNMTYASGGGLRVVARRIRVRSLEEERYLIAWEMDAGDERTYRLDRILKLDDGEDTYLSAWGLSHGNVP